jgi:hypothetical protein
VTLPALPVTRQFTIGKSAQVITFAPISRQSHTSGVVVLTATASSGLTITFTTSTPAVCTVSDATVTLLAPGRCRVVAGQLGDAVWAAASPVARTFRVT